MGLLDEMLKLPPEKLKPIIDRLKQLQKNKEDFYKKYDKKQFGDFSKSIKKEDGWTDNKSMKKVFSVPLEVYMSNPEYWDKVCRDKKLQKNHPEWKVGKSINKFTK